ncbi:MAG: hypothetical protein JNL71_06150 [Rhodospirillales bacterium]|nr:hypothetical protein [Rhodospirillales bacterium]
MKPAPAVRPFAWPLLAVLLAIYVVAETAFNFRLVDTVAAAEIDPDELDRLTTLGKLSGAFGLVLFGVRPVLQRLRRLRAWHAAAFLGAWAAAYGALTVVYETVLDRVPVEMQHEAFQLALYREAVFSGAIENTDLRAREGALEDSHRLALVNLAARLTGDKPEILAVRDWLARGEMARLEGVELDPRAEAALARARDAGDGTLRNATAAMFLPPMSMTLSLLAIVANLGALAALVLARARRRRVRRFAAIVPLLAVAVFLMAADRPPFAADSANFHLYTQLESRLGFVGWIWGRAINGEAAILKMSADAMPAATARHSAGLAFEPGEQVVELVERAVVQHEFARSALAGP